MSRKQEIYRELLWSGLPVLRNSFTYPVWSWVISRRKLGAIAELIHNLPVSVLEPDFTPHDIHFMNHQARYYCEATTISTEPFLELLRELFQIIPQDCRGRLTWEGPKAR
jgi:hypothetical protein